MRLAEAPTLDTTKANRIISQTNAQNGVTHFAYDQAGNLVSVTDARNNTTSFTYDLMNGLFTRTDPLGRADSRTCDLSAERRPGINPFAPIVRRLAARCFRQRTQPQTAGFRFLRTPPAPSFAPWCLL